MRYSRQLAGATSSLNYGHVESSARSNNFSVRLQRIQLRDSFLSASIVDAT